MLDWLSEHWGVLVVALLVATVVSLIAARLHLVYWVKRLRVVMEYASIEKLECPDGAVIELRRLPPAPLAEARGEGAGLPPILLVHGLGSSHRNVDMHPDISLARHLSRRGRDVWLLTLRSGRVEPRRAVRRHMKFAAMAEHDLTVAVDAVLERTGATSVDYVGFSMGGMLLYAALSRGLLRDKLRRVAIIGSPGKLLPPMRWMRVLRVVPAALIPGAPFRIGARAAAFAAEWFPTPIHGVIYNPRNVAPGMTRMAMINGLEDIPASLQADFAKWALGDGVVRIHGEDVLDGLGDVDIPVVFFAGSVDKLAPPEAVRAAHDAWGHELSAVTKRFVLLGREHGARGDYGHGDLAVGRYLVKDLFEPLAAFLDDVPPAPAGSN